MAAKKPFLVASNISKSFSGVQALDDVSITINTGEVVCLCGENGSGKSTFIKTIAGVHPPTAGEILINDHRYERLRPIDAIQEGIQVIYQDFSLFPNLSVAENIAMSKFLSEGRRLVNWRETQRLAREALALTEVDLPLNRKVEDLSVAGKQLTAISRAILQDARLIIMDEPTTALTEKEVVALFKVIDRLTERGIATLFVSHKLNEVLEIAKRVIVLRNGTKVLDTAAADLDENKIAYYMTGIEVTEQPYTAHVPEGSQPLLEVENLSAAGRFEGISFQLLPGEILGITGLLGSGRTSLALALFGLEPADSGTIRINGQAVHIRSIQDAIRHRIGYVPEDRLTEGLFLEQSIANNIVVRKIRELLNQLGIIKLPQREEQVSRWVADLRIKTNDPTLPVRSLSGGNQQRVVIAKWLAAEPRLLILNGPTVGVDVGSKSELHEIVKDLAREGIGILVISDDIPELMQVCNRVLLMRAGQLVEQYETQAIDQATLSDALRAATQTA